MDNRETVSYSVKLDAWLRRDGREWLAWCPSIDVTTQARTKKKVLESLREAVQLWFESCIERNVLDAALREAGFEKVSDDEELLEGSNVIKIQRLTPDMPAPELHFSLDHRKGNSFIEGVIPAYLAAHQLGDSARACG